MKTEELYATAQSAERMAEITREIRDHIDGALVERDVDTSFARTHVVEGGKVDGPPLVVLHGGGVNSIFALFFVQGLFLHHRVIGVDIPGQPGESASVFLDPRGNDNGLWLREVADALGLAEANYLGISWGGYVLQRFAAVAPERIAKAVFLVPAGIVNPPTLPMVFGFLLPRLLCKWTGNMKYLRPFFARLFTDTDDPLIREYFEIYFRDVRADMRPMKRSRPEEMKSFTAPKLFLGADQDIFFPAEKMRARCAKVFPEPLEFITLENSMHSPSMRPDKLAELVGVMDAFLREDAAG